MIDVLIITFNEAINLPHCLTAMQQWTKKIFVIDSGSTDGTQDLARSMGAEVIHHDWTGYAAQKNWGLDNLPFESDWILIVDADEIITPKLRDELIRVASVPMNQIRENGFFINRLTYFLSRPIRHCGYFPSWNMRFFKRGQGRYENRAVHEHIVIRDPVSNIAEPMLHQDRRGLEHYFAKHNRYSTLEAQQLYREIFDPTFQASDVNVTVETRRRRWLKRHVTQFVPFPSLWRFLYMYMLRLGILDGKAGFQFCRFIATYDAMVALKLRDLVRRSKMGEQIAPDEPVIGSALAMPEGSEVFGERSTAKTVKATQEPSAVVPIQMQPEASPWTFSEKVVRALWMILGRPVFRTSFHNWYKFRVSLLRLFGAKIGQQVAIRPSVNVEIPWNLEIDDNAIIGDYAILYSLGKIRIGRRSIISQYTHLCAGTHDYTDQRFRLIRDPITIGDDVWIGADAFIGPRVHVGPLTVVGARTSVYKNLAAGQVYVGNPARSLKERILQ